MTKVYIECYTSCGEKVRVLHIEQDGNFIGLPISPKQVKLLEEAKIKHIGELNESRMDR